MWSELTASQKADAIRPLLERDGLSYSQAAAALGVSRVTIAGVVDRAKRRGEPISNSHVAGWPRWRKKRTDNQIVARKAAEARKGPKTPKNPKRKHLGYDRFVALLIPPGAETLTPVLASAWDPLPGSSPVPLEHRAGCSWPLGESPFTFCNLPVQEGKSWCEHHYAIGIKVIAPGTPVRRSAKLNKYPL